MADSAEDIVASLLREDSTAIEFYRPTFATPQDVESIRFWVQNELDSIQRGFSSTDDVVKQLAEAISNLVDRIVAEGGTGSQGPKGDRGDKGDPGDDASGRQVYVSYNDPLAAGLAVEGDIWVKLRG